VGFISCGGAAAGKRKTKGKIVFTDKLKKFQSPQINPLLHNAAGL
jgi:hypothetical protein